MKKLTILLLSVLLPVCLPAQPDEPTLTGEQEAAVLAAANSWFEVALTGASLSRLMSLSDVPFSFDGERILATYTELEETFAAVFEEKGLREVPRYTSFVQSYTMGNALLCIPINAAVVKLQTKDDDGDGKSIIVAVLLKDNTCKVVGFNDF